jgi:hypothetical protein
MAIADHGIGSVGSDQNVTIRELHRVCGAMLEVQRDASRCA